MAKKINIMGRDLSTCEALIMRIVWDSEENISVPELIATLSKEYGRDYARTTVVTFLERLRNKGYVETYRAGRISYVKVVKSKESYLDDFLSDVTDFWYGGHTEMFVKALFEAKAPTPSERIQIRNLLDKLETQGNRGK